MSVFPLKFKVSAKATCGISKRWTSSTNDLPAIDIAIAPEFNGPGKAYTPEHLYGMAIINCLIAVYKALAEKNNMKFEKIESQILVTIDKKHENGELVLSHLDITFNVIGAKDKEKARFFLEKAIKECPITNSTKAGKTCHINIK